MATLLEALSDLRALRFVGAAPLPEHGLTPPRVRVEVELGTPARSGAKQSPENKMEAPAKPELSIELGAPVDARGDCYARRAESPQVAILPAASCAALTQPLLSPLVLRVDDDRLIAVSLTPATAAALACTRVDGRWRCGGPELPTAARRTLLAALHGLEHGESPTYAAEPAAPVATRRDQEEMIRELRQVKGLIEERFGALAFMEKLQRQPAQARLTQKLLDCGFSPALIRKLADAMPHEVNDETSWAASVLERNLVTGEADGALDPERKRRFMAMKREVLRLGGYACEFFVSQTPELTGMADRIIDLEGMATQVAEEVV